MAKTVDITERTLEQEKQSFQKTCKGFWVFSNVCRIVMSVCVVLLLLCAVLALCGVAEMQEEMGEGVLAVVFGCVVLAGFCVALNFGVDVFRILKDSDTPFRYDVADKLKGAGITLTVTGAAAFVLNVAVHMLSLESNEFYADIGGFPDASTLAFGLALMALAYVFNYGCKLQREYDETL